MGHVGVIMLRVVGFWGAGIILFLIAAVIRGEYRHRKLNSHSNSHRKALREMQNKEHEDWITILKSEIDNKTSPPQRDIS